MPAYRVTNLDVMRDNYGRRVRGVAVAGGPEAKLGREPHGLTFKRGDLVYVEQPGDLVPVFYAPGGPSGDRLWTRTHVLLLDMQITTIGDLITRIDESSDPENEESKDARDLYHRIRQTLINMRRPVEG